MTGDLTSMTVSTGACTQPGSAQIQVQAVDSEQTKTFNVVLQIADFSLAAAPGGDTQTVTAGQPATYNVIVAPATGFSPSVSFSCTVAPAIPTCSVSPAQLQLSSNQAPVTVSVLTDARTNAQLSSPKRFRDFGLWSGILGIICAALLLVYKPRNHRTGLLALFALALVFLNSCGGSTTTSPPSGNNGTSGTPRGTYVVTVTGTSATSTRTLTLNLNVN
jgi:hypothetical protein